MCTEYKLPIHVSRLKNPHKRTMSPPGHVLGLKGSVAIWEDTLIAVAGFQQIFVSDDRGMLRVPRAMDCGDISWKPTRP